MKDQNLYRFIEPLHPGMYIRTHTSNVCECVYSSMEITFRFFCTVTTYSCLFWLIFTEMEEVKISKSVLILYHMLRDQFNDFILYFENFLEQVNFAEQPNPWWWISVSPTEDLEVVLTLVVLMEWICVTLFLQAYRETFFFCDWPLFCIFRSSPCVIQQPGVPS